MTSLKKEKKASGVQMHRTVFSRAPDYSLESYSNQNWGLGQARTSDIKSNEMAVWISYKSELHEREKESNIQILGF